ncbi:MAG TPA: FAD-binding oxidoreductase, partial [Halieaceae bacterium]|nr:FAD-binding oxidoreductase [Halieaceae bacterium]
MGVDLGKLIQLLGDTGVLRDEDVLARPNAAWGAGSCPARAIIRADATETLSQAMALCYQNGQTMVPLGGLTGLVNGMTCAEQDVGISLERMNQIEDFDTDTGIMTVQAGVPLQLVQ